MYGSPTTNRTTTVYFIKLSKGTQVLPSAGSFLWLPVQFSSVLKYVNTGSYSNQIMAVAIFQGSFVVRF